MNSKTILMVTLAALLIGSLSLVPAVTAAPEAQAQATTPEASPAPTAGQTDAPTWTCPECGAQCPAPFARRGQGHHGRRGGMRAPRGDFGKAGDFGRGGRGGRGHGPGAGVPSDRVLRQATRLELTDQQIEQLEKLAYDAKVKLIDLESDLDKARLEMRREMETNGDDLTALKKQLDSVSKKRVTVQELKLKNWIDTKSVLTDEQKKLIGQRHAGFGMRL